MKNLKFVFLFLTVIAIISSVSCKENNQQKIKSEENYNSESQMSSDNEIQKLESALKEKTSVTFVSGSKSIELECFYTDKKNLMIPLEDICSFLELDFEVCGRCGNVAVTVPDKSGDVVLFQWQAPYVDYRNRSDRLVLEEFNFYNGKKTYVHIESLTIAKIVEFKIDGKNYILNM